jgi:4-hydroxymandelate synthase
MNIERRASSYDNSDLRLGYVELFVEDLKSTVEFLSDSYGLVAEPSPVADSRGAGHRSVTLRRAAIEIVVTEAVSETHPAWFYVQRHGDGVGNLGFSVPDATAAFEDAVAKGAVPVTSPRGSDHTGVTVAVIRGFGDVLHTFVERHEGEPTRPRSATGLRRVDHLAVCLESGELDPTTEFYESVLGFATVFEERIIVGTQSMLSKVVQSPSREVTLTLIEPDPRSEAGQIDDFLKRHGGPGVQHIAFESDDIVRSVTTLSDNGVGFLTTPHTYYDVLSERLNLAAHSVQELRERNILVDEDHDGQLFQIFARSVHPRNTLFFEVIERLGAKTFGSGNIKALYEAVEAARAQGEPTA